MYEDLSLKEIAHVSIHGDDPASLSPVGRGATSASRGLESSASLSNMSSGHHYRSSLALSKRLPSVSQLGRSGSVLMGSPPGGKEFVQRTEMEARLMEQKQHLHTVFQAELTAQAEEALRAQARANRLEAERDAAQALLQQKNDVIQRLQGQVSAYIAKDIGRAPANAEIAVQTTSTLSGDKTTEVKAERSEESAVEASSCDEKVGSSLVE